MARDTYRELFAKRLKIACLVKGIKRKDLAENTNMSYESLNQVFQGKSVSAKRMEDLRLATGFNEIDFIKLAE